ncbi:alpha/beta hydrolase [Adhaeribacter swui]|uniref:Alpha/beta hydrolase n=1 Tax=Adhaeribacter swui TaxID=2086471 RepID=A0A7G7GA03_9BACT|nr:alpha/beta hydrolase [Adhaeribacter swui]QNF33987.1 alpha/beta hydrolase [Adhaeribacter swui]
MNRIETPVVEQERSRELLIQNKDTTLFTRFYPNKDKETIILLHGGPGVPEGLSFITKYLQAHYQIIDFHQRGTRQSPTKSNDFSLESYVSDVNCLADYFKLEQFHLFGHSWGGLYAQVYAQQHPERLLSMFLCSPATGTGKQWKDTMLEIADYNKNKSSYTEWVAMQAESGLGLLGSDKAYQKFYSQALRNFSRGFTEAYTEKFALDCIKAKAINQTVKAILKYPLLPEKIIPEYKLTIAYGARDIYGKSKRCVMRRYPTIPIIFIPGSGHIPWSHNMEVFVNILREHYGV